MRKITALLVFLATINFAGCNKSSETTEFKVSGVENPVISLNGTWKLNRDPMNDFWKASNLNTDWSDIQVPGELMMQGFVIKHDEPFAYQKELVIPGDYEGKRIYLQFDGVYSYARVWVNGEYVRDHSGGFTAWDCEITDYVKAGESSILTVEVTDKADEISYASGYAKHQIGGILREVNLLALPENSPVNISIETDLDNEYKDAILKISGEFSNPTKESSISFELVDPNQNKVKLENSTIGISASSEFETSYTIPNPEKWDAEHPNLYNLILSFSEGEEVVWQKCFPVGFREVSIEGNKLLVNGQEVKLRGACRHDIHPLLGRVSTPEYEIKDVLLAKEANMNFIRTSHYPPTENFLKLCDEYGLYVEDETAVCFVGSHRTKVYYPGASESDSAYSARYLSQLKEMVTNHKNHPSIIIWSIGNENSFGSNFKDSYDWVKAEDKTRPVIFSYPGHVPDGVKAYDILSMHYPGINGTMNQVGKETFSFGYKDMPVIFDEWAHVACYNNLTVKEDPNIRDFWGMSLDSMWQKTYDADGGLGGAIWGMIDENFMLPDTLPGFDDWWGLIDANVIPAEYSGHNIGYGEWGIIDTWRRKKPEFWNTKKAYSPVRVLQTSIDDYTPGSSIIVPVYNRFDHTNLNELEIMYHYKDESGMIKVDDIKAHSKGELSIPISDWEENEDIKLEILDINGSLIDCYMINQNQSTEFEITSSESGTISVEEDLDQITVICDNNTKLLIDKTTGLISDLLLKDDQLKFNGPHLNMRTRGNAVIYSYHEIQDYNIDRKLDSFDWTIEENKVRITSNLSYADGISVIFIIDISSDGLINTNYQVLGVPGEYIREMGIKYLLSNKLDSISWERDPYWSYYPSDHLSSKNGVSPIYSSQVKRYREEPTKDWSQDSKSFYYNGTQDEGINQQLINRTKSTKENIFDYSLFSKGEKIISVLGNGKESCSLSKENDLLQLTISNEVDYVDLSWGNYQRNILLEDNYTNNIALKINPLEN